MSRRSIVTLVLLVLFVVLFAASRLPIDGVARTLLSGAPALNAAFNPCGDLMGLAGAVDAANDYGQSEGQ